MTFVTALALGLIAFIAAPLLAHRLRRLRADERPFAAAHLVPPAQPRARRRAKLEDKALFGVRAAAVVALALLGASPLVRCSRLSLTRSSGASMAVVLVVDDSMSMRAATSTKRSRFIRARDAAADLLAGVRDGDAVGVVLAGAPARVALAPTTDVTAVASIVNALPESDRATDLDGALRMAESLLGSLPQVDKRVVVLSDLADGQPDAPPLGDSISLPLWAPLEDIAAEQARDCAVLSADETDGRVRVRLACGNASAEGRTLELRLGTQVLGSTTCSKSDDVTIVPTSLKAGDLTVHLLGGDAVASDDVAPVLVASAGSIGVVVEAADETAVTGGPPVVEQALHALRIDLVTRPLPAVPEQAVDFTGIAGLIVDDPPGFTPEQRHALEGWLDGGGVLLLALGPRAAAAPLGATLEPVLHHATTWRETKQVKGVAADAKTDFLGEATHSIMDLGAAHRSLLAPDDTVTALVQWSDGAPLVAGKTMGRGQVFVTTLPFALDASDLPLRPAFLSLLDAFALSARDHAAPRRTDVGSAWMLPLLATSATGPDGKPADIVRADDRGRVTLTPSLVGAYHVMVDGHDELRVAAPVSKETDMRPRRIATHAGSSHIGATQAQVDISAEVAIALLALMLAELALRLRARAQPT